MAHTYQEHRDHKKQHSRVGHITRGYATGGAVHSDEREDEKLIKKEVKKSALKRADGGKIDGEKARHHLGKHAGKVRRADGGKVKGKKKAGTNVNVIVTPHSGQPGMGGPMGAPAPAAAPPAPPPPPRPPMAPPMAGPGMPPGMPPPGGGAPPMMRARGGKVKAGSAKGSEIECSSDSALPKRARGGKIDNANAPGEELKKAYDTGRANSSTGAGRPKDGPAWKEGLRNGTQISHTAGNTAGASLAAHQGVKKVRTYRTGGKVKDVSVNEKPAFSKAVEAGMGSAKANPWPVMRAGSKSGVGRLEKVRGASHGDAP